MRTWPFTLDVSEGPIAPSTAAPSTIDASKSFAVASIASPSVGAIRL